MPNFHLGHAFTDLDTWLHPIDSLRISALCRGEHDQIRGRHLLRRAAPTTVSTFLFTDIEGSTRRWETEPAAMMTALDLHNRTLLHAITTHGGHVFSYTGDGMCAVFASPARAVGAAVAAQQALNLPVRMGLATGEAEKRGNNYFGTVLNRTARVMAAGHGGQILLDGATAVLLNGVEMVVLGRRRLRDIARPVDMFQVRAPGLRVEFPPLKTADPTPGKLRSRTDSFVGRQKDLADVLAALEGHRLVTLTGVGGVGKTRLALEVGARLSQESAHDVCVIDLTSIEDPAAVPNAIAAALGITLEPGLSPADNVLSALAGRAILLVLDNCEHVLDATAGFIETLLVGSAEVRILATSRERLAVPGERPWRVDPLDTRPGSAAATLFVDRARAIVPDIALGTVDQNVEVAEICRRVDGIPLAIEMAAARLISMTVSELRDRLEEPLRLLAGSSRAVERHHTLHQSLQWSYRLLDGPEKSVFARCSVFAGSFDVAAVAVVSGAHDEFRILELLDALVRKSLLLVDRTSAVTRFSMLGLIRDFAEEQLEARGEAIETLAALSESTCAATRLPAGARVR